MAKQKHEPMNDQEIIDRFQEAKARGFRCESDAAKAPKIWGSFDPNGKLIKRSIILIQAMEACVRADIASMVKAAKDQGAAPPATNDIEVMARFRRDAARRGYMVLMDIQPNSRFWLALNPKGLPITSKQQFIDALRVCVENDIAFNGDPGPVTEGDLAMARAQKFAMPEEDGHPPSSIHDGRFYARLFNQHAASAGYLVQSVRMTRPDDADAELWPWRAFAPEEPSGHQPELDKCKTLAAAQRSCFLHFLYASGRVREVDFLGGLADLGLDQEQLEYVVRDLFNDYVSPAGYRVEWSSSTLFEPFRYYAPDSTPLGRAVSHIWAKAMCVRHYIIERGKTIANEKVPPKADVDGGSSTKLSATYSWLLELASGVGYKVASYPDSQGWEVHDPAGNRIATRVTFAEAAKRCAQEYLLRYGNPIEHQNDQEIFWDMFREYAEPAGYAIEEIDEDLGSYRGRTPQGEMLVLESSAHDARLRCVRHYITTVIRAGHRQSRGEMADSRRRNKSDQSDGRRYCVTFWFPRVLTVQEFADLIMPAVRSISTSTGIAVDEIEVTSEIVDEDRKAAYDG